MGKRLNGQVVSDHSVITNGDLWLISNRMEPRVCRTRLRGVVGICVILALTGIVYLGYFCPDHVCALTNRDLKESTRLSEGFTSGIVDRNFQGHPSFRLQSIQGSLGYEDVINDTFQFDINAHDVMVFLHIQKTG